MSKLIKNFLGALSVKPWEKDQMKSDNYHIGKTFDISLQTSAVIIIFGVSTVLFSLIVTGYLYSIPAGQDTQYLLKPNLLWINTFILLLVTYFFNRVTKDLKKNFFTKVKKNLLIVGILSYIFLFGQILFWFQLMENGNYVSTNNYFSSFYIFTTLHGLHLLGGLVYWNMTIKKVWHSSEIILSKAKHSVELCAIYWHFLLAVWIVLFGLMLFT